MGERGYSVDDCGTYDMMTEEEREEKRRNPPDYGLEGFEYKRKKTRELEERIASQENKFEKLDAREEKLDQRERELAEREQVLEQRSRPGEQVQWDLTKPCGVIIV